MGYECYEWLSRKFKLIYLKSIRESFLVKDPSIQDHKIFTLPNDNRKTQWFGQCKYSLLLSFIKGLINNAVGNLHITKPLEKFANKQFLLKLLEFLESMGCHVKFLAFLVFRGEPEHGQPEFVHDCFKGDWWGRCDQALSEVCCDFKVV